MITTDEARTQASKVAVKLVEELANTADYSVIDTSIERAVQQLRLVQVELDEFTRNDLTKES